MQPLSRLVGVCFLTSFIFVGVFSVNLFAQSPEALEVGKPVERQMAGGEAHTYRLPLKAGEFVYLKAEQMGIDVVLTLIDADGKKVLEVDGPTGARGVEELRFIADASADYRIEIRSLEKNAAPGKYKAFVVESRPSTEDDRLLVAAFRNELEADALARNPTNEEAKIAAKKYEEAAELFKKLGRAEREAADLANVGQMYAAMSDFDAGIKYTERALVLFESANNKAKVAALTSELAGMSWAGLPDNTQAIEYFKKAIDLKLSLGDQRGAARDHNDLGRLYAGQGEFDNALNSFEQALKLGEAGSSKNTVSSTLINISNLYKRFGNFAKALEFRERSLAVAEAAGAKPLVASNLAGIGMIYADQGNDAAALDYSERAVKLSESSRDNPLNRAGALNTMGTIYLNRGEYDQALNCFNRLGEIYAQARMKDAYTPVNIGMVRYAQGRYDEAISYFQKAIDDFGGNHPKAMMWLAKSLAVRGDLNAALKMARSMIERIEPPTAATNYTAQAYTTTGEIELALARYDEAEKDLNRAISIIEDIRSQIAGGANEQAQFLDRNMSPYNSMVRLQVERKLYDSAFATSERSKSRSLLDALRGGRVDFLAQLDADSRSRETNLRRELATLNNSLQREQSLKNHDNGKIAEFERSIGQKRLEIEDFHAKLLAVRPELRVRTGQLRPITLPEVSSLLPTPKSAVLEYTVESERTYVFLITSTGRNPALKVYSIDINSNELAKRVEAFRSRLASGDLGFSDEGRALYDLLLGPAAAEFTGKADLVIVPDGPLWGLPFHSLIDPKGKYMAELSAVSYAPSLTALREMRRESAGRKREKSLLAFGNPTVGKETSESVKRVFMGERLEPLPEAERLVNSLKQMYGPSRSEIFTGADAREATAKKEASKFRILQFAAHGVLNDASPMYSHIVLSQKGDDPNEDGLLEAWEMKDLDLNADLVILSACDTARGRVSSGEGMIGMTWAMFIAGAPTTVASQWKVESSSTTELMLEFHRQLLTGKVSKAEALRRAEMKVMKMPQYRHPAYWAGFVLVGDGS